MFQANLLTGSMSISCHLLIDLFRPRVYATLKIDDLCKSSIFEKVCHLITSGTMMTDHDNSCSCIQLIQPADKSGHRDINTSGYATDIELPRFPYIKQYQLVIIIQTVFKPACINPFHCQQNY